MKSRGEKLFTSRVWEITNALGQPSRTESLAISFVITLDSGRLAAAFGQSTSRTTRQLGLPDARAFTGSYPEAGGAGIRVLVFKMRAPGTCIDHVGFPTGHRQSASVRSRLSAGKAWHKSSKPERYSQRGKDSLPSPEAVTHAKMLNGAERPG